MLTFVFRDVWIFNIFISFESNIQFQLSCATRVFELIKYLVDSDNALTPIIYWLGQFFDFEITVNAATEVLVTYYKVIKNYSEFNKYSIVKMLIQYEWPFIEAANTRLKTFQFYFIWKPCINQVNYRDSFLIEYLWPQEMHSKSLVSYHTVTIGISET